MVELCLEIKCTLAEKLNNNESGINIVWLKYNTNINKIILRENDVYRVHHQDELQKKETKPYLNSFFSPPLSPFFYIIIMFPRLEDESQNLLLTELFLPSLIEYIFFSISEEQTNHVFSLLRQGNKYSKSFYAQFQFLIEKKLI